MSAKGTINVGQVIVHKVDHTNSASADCMDLESPVSTDVSNFLKQHINDNREHKFARSGVFKDPPADQKILKDMCDELLSSSKMFVPCSREIAQHLFTSINYDKRVSPGDLVVFTFTDGAKNPPWLALLKMDPKSGFVGVREEIEGKARMVLHQVSDVLPSGELQKCAFILPKQLRRDRQHLIVLDQQQTARFNLQKVVASFFSRDFLQCTVNLSQREKARAFLLGSHGWVENKRGVWADKRIEHFQRHVSSVVKEEVVDVTAVAETLIRKPDEQIDYLDHIREAMRAEGVQDLIFEPDPQIQQQTNYVYIRGDNDLEIRIRADGVGKNKTLFHEPDEASNRQIISIRTTKFEKEIRRGYK